MKSILVNRKQTSGDVCIAFSARDTPPGKFTFFNTLAELPLNTIFVNDYGHRWYLGGTPDFSDESQFVEWLQAQIAALKSPGSRLFTIGSSMGAYAALRYGSILNADRVLALGPESELCIPLGRSVTSIVGRAEGDCSIAGLPYKSPQGVLVIAGNNDIVDFYCACKLKAGNPDINVHLINNRTHVVAKYLNAHFGLNHVVQAFFVEERSDFLISCDAAPTDSIEVAVALKMFNQRLAEREVAVEYSRPIRDVAARIPQWSMPQYFCALIAEANGDAAGVERHLQAAITAQPNLGRAILRLAKFYYSAKRFAACIDLLKTVSPAQYNFTFADLLSKAYEQAGSSESALLALRRLSLEKLDVQTRSVLTRRLRALQKLQRAPAQANGVVVTLRNGDDKHHGFVAESGFSMKNSSITFVDGSKGRLRVGRNCRLIDATIQVGADARIDIGHDCVIRGQITADAGSFIRIGDALACNNKIDAIAAERSGITIGNDCLMADVTIRNSDGHSIFCRTTGDRLNVAEDVVIGDRVWAGQRVAILKGARIASDSVVALGSVVTRAFSQSNVVIADVPGRIIRENISWSRQVLDRKPIMNGLSAAQMKLHASNHVLMASLGRAELHRYLDMDESTYALFYYTARSLYEVHFKSALEPAAFTVPGEPEITLPLILHVLQHCNEITYNRNRYCVAYECAVLSALGKDSSKQRKLLLQRWPQMRTFLERLMPQASCVSAA